jgi:ArsR family transcriptional regulator
MTINNQEIKSLLDGLRDPICKDIILPLAKGTPMNVGEITSQFNISRPAVSHHLKVLKDAGFLISQKMSRKFTIFWINQKL